MRSTATLSGANPQEVNLSAVRTFYLLQWLMASPEGLSLEAINQRFRQCADVGKTFSDDTVCLYLNTLRALGCTIQRPSKRNQHRYQLTRHPFSPFHLPAENATQSGEYSGDALIQGLAEAKRILASQLSYPELLALDVLITRLITETDPGSSSNAATENYYRLSRSVDYRPYMPIIHELETHLSQNTSPLQVTYASLKASKTPTQLTLKPTQLIYSQGALYLCGTPHPSAQPTSEHRLRVDRIINCRPFTEAITDALPPQPNHLPIVFQVLTSATPTDPRSTAGPVGSIGTPTHWQDWLNALAGNGILHSIEIAAINHKDDTQWLSIKAAYTDEFLLLQHFYQSPFPVRIISPPHLHRQLQEELQNMVLQYASV